MQSILSTTNITPLNGQLGLNVHNSFGSNTNIFSIGIYNRYYLTATSIGLDILLPEIGSGITDIGFNCWLINEGSNSFDIKNHDSSTTYFTLYSDQIAYCTAKAINNVWNVNIASLNLVAGTNISIINNGSEFVINATGSATTVPINRTVFVDSVFGNDGTGAIEDMSKPYQTIQAAATALNSAYSGTAKLVYIWPGTYSHSSGNLFFNNMFYYFSPGTVFNVTANCIVGNSNSVNFGIINEGVINCTIAASGYFINISETLFGGNVFLDLNELNCNLSTNCITLINDIKNRIKIQRYTNTIASANLLTTSFQGNAIIEIDNIVHSNSDSNIITLSGESSNVNIHFANINNGTLLNVVGDLICNLDILQCNHSTGYAFKLGNSISFIDIGYCISTAVRLGELSNCRLSINTDTITNTSNLLLFDLSTVSSGVSSLNWNTTFFNVNSGGGNCINIVGRSYVVISAIEINITSTINLTNSASDFNHCLISSHLFNGTINCNGSILYTDIQTGLVNLSGTRIYGRCPVQKIGVNDYSIENTLNSVSSTVYTDGLLIAYNTTGSSFSSNNIIYGGNITITLDDPISNNPSIEHYYNTLTVDFVGTSTTLDIYKVGGTLDIIEKIVCNITARNSTVNLMYPPSSVLDTTVNIPIGVLTTTDSFDGLITYHKILSYDNLTDGIPGNILFYGNIIYSFNINGAGGSLGLFSKIMSFDSNGDCRLNTGVLTLQSGILYSNFNVTMNFLSSTCNCGIINIPNNGFSFTIGTNNTFNSDIIRSPFEILTVSSVSGTSYVKFGVSNTVPTIRIQTLGRMVIFGGIMTNGNSQLFINQSLISSSNENVVNINVIDAEMTMNSNLLNVIWNTKIANNFSIDSVQEGTLFRFTSSVITTGTLPLFNMDYVNVILFCKLVYSIAFVYSKSTNVLTLQMYIKILNSFGSLDLIIDTGGGGISASGTLDLYEGSATDLFTFTSMYEKIHSGFSVLSGIYVCDILDIKVEKTVYSNSATNWYIKQVVITSGYRVCRASTTINLYYGDSIYGRTNSTFTFIGPPSGTVSVFVSYINISHMEINSQSRQLAEGNIVYFRIDNLSYTSNSGTTPMFVGLQMTGDNYIFIDKLELSSRLFSSTSNTNIINMTINSISITSVPSGDIMTIICPINLDIRFIYIADTGNFLININQSLSSSNETNVGILKLFSEEPSNARVSYTSTVTNKTNITIVYSRLASILFNGIIPANADLSLTCETSVTTQSATTVTTTGASAQLVKISEKYACLTGVGSNSVLSHLGTNGPIITSCVLYRPNNVTVSYPFSSIAYGRTVVANLATTASSNRTPGIPWPYIDANVIVL